MKIKFLQSHKVQQSDGLGPEYASGQVYRFDGAVAHTYANKYVNRGLAEHVGDDVPAVNDQDSLKPYAELVHVRRGKYNVRTADGRVLNTSPLPQADALALRDEFMTAPAETPAPTSPVGLSGSRSDQPDEGLFGLPTDMPSAESEGERGVSGQFHLGGVADD